MLDKDSRILSELKHIFRQDGIPYGMHLFIGYFLVDTFT